MFRNFVEIYYLTCSFSDSLVAHVRYIKIITRLRGFLPKSATFLRFLCLAVPIRNLMRRKRSLAGSLGGAMTEF